MKILALEFSSTERSVAVVEASTAAEVVSRAAPGGKARAAKDARDDSIALIEAALVEARVEREQIECVVVGLGPGSYTGIRSAIALAQGWELARGVRLLGVSSADCIAAQAQADGVQGKVSVVIDAQRNEFYLAEYEIGPQRFEALRPLRLATRAEAQARQDAGQLLVGPEVMDWFPSGRLVMPRAATAGRLGLSRSDFVPGEKLEPIYLRETAFVKAPVARKRSG